MVERPVKLPLDTPISHGTMFPSVMFCCTFTSHTKLYNLILSAFAKTSVGNMLQTAKNPTKAAHLTAGFLRAGKRLASSLQLN